MSGDSASMHRTLFVADDPVGPVRGLRKALDSFLHDRGIDEQTSRAVVLAFSEALDNAVEHGTLNHRGEIQVRIRYTPRFILVSLQDMGSDRTPLGLVRDPGPGEERGRGFALMNKLMHYVRVRSFPDGGTRVSMLRLLPARP